MSHEEAIELLKKARKWVSAEYVCCRKYSGCRHGDPKCPVYQIDKVILFLEQDKQ